MIQFSSYNLLQQNNRKSTKHLLQLRQHLRKSSSSCIKQITANQQLYNHHFTSTQQRFFNSQSINQQLKQQNQQIGIFQNSNIAILENIQNLNANQLNQSITQSKSNKQLTSNATTKIIQQQQKLPQNENKLNIIHFDETRKWNKIPINPKKGKYTPQQTKLLMQGLSQYLSQNNIELNWFVERINQQKSQKIPSNLKLWAIVGSVLPNRSLESTYKFLRRKLSINNKGGKWTSSQQKSLLQLYSIWGNNWKIISKQLRRTPQNVRDKFRNLRSRNTQVNSPQKQQWTIEQLVSFFKQIQNSTSITFLKQGIDELLQNAQQYNQKQLATKKQFSYNSKSLTFPNNIKLLQFINSDKFIKINHNKIKWKSISNQLSNKTQLSCKNKFFQFIQILNRDQSGQTQSKVIHFIQQSINQTSTNTNNQQTIDWQKWSQTKEQLSVEQAKYKWKIITKKIRKTTQKTLLNTLQLAKLANERKKFRNKARKQKFQVKRQLNKQHRDKFQQIQQSQKQKVQTIPILSTVLLEQHIAESKNDLPEQTTPKIHHPQQKHNNLPNKNTQLETHQNIQVNKNNQLNFQTVKEDDKNKNKLKQQNSNEDNYQSKNQQIKEKKKTNSRNPQKQQKAQKEPKMKSNRIKIGNSNKKKQKSNQKQKTKEQSKIKKKYQNNNKIQLIMQKN